MSTFVVPLAPSGDITSHEELWVEGKMFTFQSCPAGTVAVIDEVTVWSAAAFSTSDAFETARAPACTGPWNGTCAVALILLPFTSTPSNSKLKVVGGVIAGQHSPACSVPMAARREEPKKSAMLSLRSKPFARKR